MVVVEGVKIEIRHQVRLDVIDRLGQADEEFVEILFVEEHLVTVVSTVFEALLAFSDRNEIIVATGSAYIKEISAALACLDALGENAVVVPVFPIVHRLSVVHV